MVIVGMLRLLAAAVVVSSPSPTPSPVSEIAHVVTSDRSDTTLRNTTRTTFIVSADDIARHGYRTVGDALRSVPGVQINSYGAIGAAASYGIRGSSSAQVLVLMNGVPAVGSLGDSVPLGTMATVGIRRIEIVEGGGSTLYGTGAIGGIINVITDAQKGQSTATLRVGSFGDRSFDVSGKGFSLERIVAQNAYDLPNGTTHQNADYEETAARFGLDRTYGPLTIALRTSLESDHLGAPGPVDFTSLTSREDDVNQDASLAFTWRRAQSTQTVQLGGSRQQILFGCDQSGVDPNCFAGPALSTAVRTTIGLRNVVSGARERLIYGIDLSRGVVRADDGTPGDPIAVNAVAQSAAYAQQNWETGSGQFYAGLRAERDGALGGEFSPSVGWRTSLGRDFDLKVNLAHAFRAPNTSELYFPNFGNPSLKAERATVGDLSLSDRALLGGVSLGWFTNRTNELIVIDQTTFLPYNAHHALLQGFTLDAKTRTAHGWSATLGLTDLYRASDLDGNSRLPHDPVMTADLGILFANAKPGFFDEAGATFHGESTRLFVTPEPAFEQAFGYNTIGAYARFRIAARTLLTLRGNNLGNARYAEIPGFPMPPSSFALELSTK